MSDFEMSANFTALSQTQWDMISGREMTAAEVVEHFYSDMPIRKSKDILLSSYSGEDLKEQLTEGLFQFKSSETLMRLFGGDSFKPPVRDSIRRTVGNWLKGDSEPNKRADLIGVCFALGFDAQRADIFMRHSTDGNFHLRKPAEAALYYCLKSGKSISQSADFIAGLNLSLSGSAAGGNAATELVAEAFDEVGDDAEFVKFLEENRSLFGMTRNTAYDYFRRYFTVLANPDVTDISEGKLSIEAVIKNYLSFNLPADRKNAQAIQSAVRAYWPGETSVKRILERVEEVTRKSLLLLYIATDGTGQDFYSGAEDKSGEVPLALLYGEEMTPEESLENHSIAINLMLKDCGFAALDTRNPFDWLILYCLRTESDGDFMSDRLTCVLERLFPEDE